MGVFAAPTFGGAATAKAKAVTVLRVAFGPGSNPTSNLPFYSAHQCTTVNIDYWQMDSRPGYWFGIGRSVAFQPSLSPLTENIPAQGGPNTVATVGVKGWKWSTAAGKIQKMTNADVLFWLNMDKAQRNAGANAACGFAPNFGIPDQLLSVKAVGGLKGNHIQLTFAGHPSHLWLVYNELSQIVPLAAAWDRTASGAANCAGEAWSKIKQDGTDTCSKVFTYLSSTKINNALWGWANGPYRQTAAGYTGVKPNGNDVQVANKFYSGPVKAHAAKTIKYVPFLATTTEVSALEAGKVDIGYADPSNVHASPGPGKAGTNISPKLKKFQTIGSTLFGVFYWMFNFDNAHSTFRTAGPTPVWANEINQLYFRQAIQASINQPAIIAHVENNYGINTYSAIPTFPKNAFANGVTNPYPYSTTRGKTIMQAHGWNTAVTPAVCTTGGANGCGTADFPIPSGSTASINLLVPNGDQTVFNQTNDEVNQVAKASAIQINAVFDTATNVQNACFGGVPGMDQPWQLCGYGGWIYAPDFYPSGEVLFAAGSSSNSGGYVSTEMDHLIAATTTNGNVALNGTDPTYHTSFAQFTASDLPFLWQFTPAGFIEQLRAIKGAQPPNPLNNFNPEYITAI